MNNETVKLPNVVAQALDQYKSDEPDSWRRLVTLVALNRSINVGGEERATLIRDFTKDEVGYATLLRALVNGYEAEQTPEDKVREYYNDQVWAHTSETRDSACKAIEKVLELLNIQIPGVNAE